MSRRIVRCQQFLAQWHNITGIGKLLIAAGNVGIKLEVNLTNRELLDEPVNMQLCNNAQNEFDAFCAINVVSYAQLFGGKIVVGLDRKHPRDLFDIKYFLDNEGFSDQIKRGFLLFLLCSTRPINEVLSPKFQSQKKAMENQFTGMGKEVFSYEEYELLRERLVQAIRAGLTAEDKQFLLIVKNATRDWNTYNLEQFPAIAWKLKNLQNLKNSNPEKHQELYTMLENLLKKFLKETN